MSMGHTAEEKIKILYEDSLLEIRELTSRLESIKAAVIALPGAADKEMKRAGAETISILAAEVAKIAHRISDDAAVAERHKAFYLAAGLLSLSSTVFFGAGIFLGTLNFTWVMLGGVSLLLGIAGGMSLLVALNGIDKKKEAVKSSTAASHTLEHLDPPPTWSQDEFKQFSSKLDEKFSERTLHAAKEVLVFGKEALEASLDNKLMPGQLGRVLLKLRGEKLK